MRRLLFTLVVLLTMAAGLISFACQASEPPEHLMTAEKQKDMMPQQALQKLLAGNQRFVGNKLRRYDYLAMAKYSAENGQFPFAIVLNCVDSRSVPEITFNQGLGNIFVARIAGNVVGKDVLASMEFATGYVGAKLIVVMGHSECGAVRAACQNVTAGNVGALTAKIKPAVDAVKQLEGQQFDCNNQHTINRIAKQNVLYQMHNIIEQSPVLAKLISDNQVMLVGAMHDLVSGKVTFFNLQGQNSLFPPKVT